MMFVSKKTVKSNFMKCVATVILFSELLCSGSAYAKSKYHNITLYIDTDKCTLKILSNGVPVKEYMVAVGKAKTPTPIGDWKVINKYKDWGKGFGTRWIGLNVPWGIYGIHGTNKPFSIGHNMSSGCVRMHNHDVEKLYELVPIGTQVKVVGHPLRYIKSLTVGSTGADVWLVQDRLTRLGFYHGRIDGRFGMLTEHALLDFEKSYGLLVDGIVGFQDYQKLGLEE